DRARAADFVLPGASYVEKEASYTNSQGRLQGTSRAFAPPADARDDWQIIVNVADALGAPLGYASPVQVRTDLAARFAGVAGLQGVAALTFSRPLEARS